MTLAAQLLTLPISVAAFHSVALVAPLANVAIVWTLAPLTGLAFVTLLLSGVPGLATVPAGLAWLLSRYVLLVVGWLAQLPQAAFSTGLLPIWAVCATYMLIFLPGLSRTLARQVGAKNPVRWGRLALVPSLIGLVAVGQLASQRPQAGGGLRVEAFDTGGDGLTLAETAGGRRVLFGSFDSGLASQALADRLPFLDRGIDLLVLTRRNGGDGAGLATLLRRFSVGLVLAPAGSGSAGDQDERPDQSGPPTIAAQPGQTIPIEDGLELQVQSVSTRSNGPDTLVARLRHQQVELVVVGGGTVEPEKDVTATIVRLAPELALSSDRERVLAAAAGSLVVVGGRQFESVATNLPHFRLDGTTIVEVRSDGVRASLERLGCAAAVVPPCRWPE
jgi:beta-lactamase superfamily II metal-dependent hydrolase